MSMLQLVHRWDCWATLIALSFIANIAIRNTLKNGYWCHGTAMCSESIFVNAIDNKWFVPLLLNRNLRSVKLLECETVHHWNVIGIFSTSRFVKLLTWHGLSIHLTLISAARMIRCYLILANGRFCQFWKALTVLEISCIHYTQHGRIRNSYSVFIDPFASLWLSKKKIFLLCIVSIESTVKLPNYLWSANLPTLRYAQFHLASFLPHFLPATWSYSGTKQNKQVCFCKKLFMVEFRL